MTTLYSATGLGSTLTVECDGDIVNLTAFSSAETRRAWANPKRADLLAALDAVDATELDTLQEEHTEYKARAEAAEAKLANAEMRLENKDAAIANLRAERDALAATVERVRAWAEDYFGVLDEAPDELRVALDPKPAFVLPTEAGISFTAKNGIGEEITFCSVWNITKDGDSVLYVNNRDYLYNGDDVLKIFTDHRLLDNNGTGSITAEDLEGLDSADVRGAQ